MKATQMVGPRGPAPIKPGVFPVVGMGCSAGGLEALFDFFAALTEPPGAAFVVVQHSYPTAKSLLASILTRHTTLPVSEAENGQALEPDHVYTIPSDKNVQMDGLTLVLSAKPARPYTAHSVDLFFRSMAETLADRAIGIVFSGMGSDGAFGSLIINHRLGMVMAQEPATAKYDEMPESVIKIDVADYILRPADMPHHLMEFIRKYYGRPAETREEGLAARRADLEELFAAVETHTGKDISIFKLATILRRITRRMAVRQSSTLEQYIQLVKQNEKEADDLGREFMIRVTEFFKEPRAFEALKEYLKALLAKKSAGVPLRAWTIGCGTGEETYSIAIVLQECLEELGRVPDFHLFATDIDRSALNWARNGIYPATVIANDVDHERIEKYFTSQDGNYRVKKEIRDRITFSIHNFTAQPSVARVDLITSRSVLLYLNSSAQRELTPVFHAYLNPGGLLFPGTQDSLEKSGFFREVDRRWKIYEKLPDGRIPAS